MESPHQREHATSADKAEQSEENCATAMGFIQRCIFTASAWGDSSPDVLRSRMLGIRSEMRNSAPQTGWGPELGGKNGIRIGIHHILRCHASNGSHAARAVSDTATATSIYDSQTQTASFLSQIGNFAILCISSRDWRCLIPQELPAVLSRRLASFQTQAIEQISELGAGC